MYATQSRRRLSATERHLLRLGIDLPLVTPAALSLFCRRRRMRLMWTWLTVVPILVVIGAGGWRAVRLPDSPSRAALHAYALRAGAGAAVIGLLCLLLAEMTRAADRRIARALPARVSRPEQVPWVTILGRVRVLYMLVALTGQAAIVTALFLSGTTSFEAYRYGVLIGFAGCTTSAIVGVVREVRRPSVAVDAVSLTIDERLRSQDAFVAVGPLLYLAITTSSGLGPFGPPGWLATTALVITGLSYLAFFWAQASTPWPKAGPLVWITSPMPQAR